LSGAATAIRRYESSARGVADVALFRRGWLPDSARASILLVHGFGEHSGRYEHVGRWFAERGFAVHAYDHRGHGRSEGRRCHVDRFDEYLDDLATLLERVRTEAPEHALFLIGHSMGGLVAATFVRERRPTVCGAVLSGAALALPQGRSRIWIARLIRSVFPRLRLSAGLDLAGLSTDPRVVEAYLADPLVERKMTASLAVELLGAVERTAPRGEDVVLPLLVLHGADDPICPSEGSERFAAAARSARFIRYPGLRHEIFNEPSFGVVLADVASFFDERMETSGSIGT
jgi:alpha-beta hydrolase superfamily lysophospholipase